jgi:phosphoglycerate dehydrogenase-like enzyme
MIRVAVLDDWQGVAASLADWSGLSARADIVFFREKLQGEEALVKALAGFDVVLAMRERTAFPEAVIARLPKLRLLTFPGARNAAIDIAACTAHGVLVCYTQGVRSSSGTAELTLALMLAAARRLPQADWAIRTGGFQNDVPPGIELQGRVLGLIGLGKIGGTMARYGHALGMEVLAWSQNLTDERAREAGATRVGKTELLERSDVVSLHVVLSERTRGILGADDLARMRRGAILVNTSRGPLVERTALLDAVGAGRVIAALDVYDVEPMAAADPLRAASNTELTPHLGYVTRENMAEFYRDNIANILAWLDGAPIRLSNPEAVPKEASEGV